MLRQYLQWLPDAALAPSLLSSYQTSARHMVLLSQQPLSRRSGTAIPTLRPPAELTEAQALRAIWTLAQTHSTTVIDAVAAHLAAHCQAPASDLPSAGNMDVDAVDSGLNIPAVGAESVQSFRALLALPDQTARQALQGAVRIHAACGPRLRSLAAPARPQVLGEQCDHATASTSAAAATSVEHMDTVAHRADPIDAAKLHETSACAAAAPASLVATLPEALPSTAVDDTSPPPLQPPPAETAVKIWPQRYEMCHGCQQLKHVCSDMTQGLPRTDTLGAGIVCRHLWCKKCVRTTYKLDFWEVLWRRIAWPCPACHKRCEVRRT